MKDPEIIAKNWLKTYGIYTNERHISLTNLLADIEQCGINEGYNNGLCKPRW